jgi:hypothetical protein
MVFSNSFNNLVYNYYIQNKTEIDKYNSVQQLRSDLTNKGSAWQIVAAHAQKDSVDLAKATATEKQLIMERFLASLARYKWRNSGFNEVVNENDSAVKRALQ